MAISATLSLGLVLLVFLLSPGTAQKKDEQKSPNPNLDASREAASSLWQNSNRMWLDAAAHMANDAVLMAALEELPRGQAEMPMLHLTARSHLAKLNETLKASFLIVTDGRGRVLARVGQDEAVYKDSIAHLPLLSEALRGVRRDDLWFAQGKMYRVAGAPVTSAARDRYVGGLIIGQLISDELAAQMQAAIGVGVVFICDGRVLASSQPRDQLPSAMGQVLREVGTALKPGGHTEPISLPNAQQVVLLGLRGEASSKGAMLALLGASVQRAPAGTVATFLSGLARAEISYLRLGLLWGGIALMFLLGLLFLRIEAERPYQRLLAQVRKIANRQAEQVDTNALPGRWHALAASINLALAASEEAAAQLPGEQPGFAPERATPPPLPTIPAAMQLIPSSSSSMSSMATPLNPSQHRPSAPPAQAPPPPRVSPTLPRYAQASGAPATSAENPQPRQLPRGQGPSPAARSERLGALEVHPGGWGPSGGYISLEPESSSARTMHDMSLEQEFQREPSQRSPFPDMPTVRDIPNSVVQAALEHALGASPAQFRAKIPSASHPRASAQASSVTPPVRSSFQAGGRPSSLTPALPTSDSAATSREIAGSYSNGSSEEELEAAFRQTYQEFVVTKQRCNEPVEGLTYDKFALKLRQSRDQIMRQHGCKAVRFHVYVKEGKAALKATPVAY